MRIYIWNFIFKRFCKKKARRASTRILKYVVGARLFCVHSRHIDVVVVHADFDFMAHSTLRVYVFFFISLHMCI